VEIWGRVEGMSADKIMTVDSGIISSASVTRYVVQRSFSDM